MDNSHELKLAVMHHQSGNLIAARDIYQKILSTKPSDHDALHNLGVLYLQLGEATSAEPLLRDAVKLVPLSSPFRFSLSECLLQLDNPLAAAEQIGEMLGKGLAHPRLEEQRQRVVAKIHASGLLSNSDGTGISQLIACYARQEYPEVINGCIKRLTQDPGRFELLHLLGVAYLATPGAEKNAIETIGQALKSNPSSDEAWDHYGIACNKTNDFWAASRAYHISLALNPTRPTTWNNLAKNLNELGVYEQAKRAADMALQLRPAFPEAYCNLGTAEKHLGDNTAAKSAYSRAIEALPDYAEAMSNLALVLKEEGDLNGAATLYQRALTEKPDFPDALNNLGNLLLESGNQIRGLDILRGLSESNPENLNYKNNLGVAYLGAGNIALAECVLREVLRLNPTHAEAINNLGNALKAQLKVSEAIDHFEAALEINPNLVDAYSNLLFSKSYLCAEDPEVARERAIKYGEKVSEKIGVIPKFTRHSSGFIRRIGFVSADFGEHPVGYFFQSVLEELRGILMAREIDIYLYSERPPEKTDRLTEYFKSSAQYWREIYRIPDRKVVDTIRNDELDIVFDLSGHTQGHRLSVFAARVAPVQVTWLGYFATTGIPSMDYILGDPYVTPLSEQRHYVERIMQLPESYLCFSDPGFDIECNTLPALETGSITFGCFNNPAKINDQVIKVWSQILSSLPNALLFLKSAAFAENTTKSDMVRRFCNHGVDESRLIVEGPALRQDLLATYRRVDIALDPFPYPGGTTSVEALWMGVPVLSKKGDRFVSHVGESILNNAGLASWIAENDADYVEKAVRFAGDMEMLSQLRKSLRNTVLSSPLFDARRFARNLVEAMENMWLNRTESRGEKQ